VLSGVASLADVERDAPAMDGFDAPAVTFEEVELLQVVFEIAAGPMQSLLPPALHPTLPPLVRWSVHRVATSPWGPFQLAQTRMECRTGVRHRGYLLGGLIDNPQAASALARGFGLRARLGTVELRRAYHEVRATAAYDGEPVLDLRLRDPSPLAPADVQLVASMHAAKTPRGLRLVQIDPEHDIVRAERGRPEVACFVAAAFGDARVEPVYPVSAIYCAGRMTLPRIRFVCRPDVWAFDGTESSADA